MKKKIAKLTGIVITVVLVAILLSQINRGNIITTLACIDPHSIIIGFALYLSSYLFRALRFHILLNAKVSIKQLFSIVCVHNLTNNLLPARTGEISYVYLIKKLHVVPTGEGIASLMVARMLDFIAISLFFFVSALHVGDLPDVIVDIIWAVAVFLMLVFLFLIASLFYGEEFSKIAEKIVVLLKLDKSRIITFLLKKGGDANECFRLMQSKKNVFCSFLLSVMIWFSMYSMSYVLLNGMHLNLSIWSVILGVTSLVLLNLLPVHGIAKFGTYEGAWTVAFISLGLSKEVAITSGFSVHIITIFYFTILGCCGLLMLKFRKV